MENNPHNPFQGVTLEAILDLLVEQIGWEEMARRVPVDCFRSKPSIRSSLIFLRRTPWARAKVEDLYLEIRRLQHDRETEG